MPWRDHFEPGELVKGFQWDGSETSLTGFVLDGDDGDNTMLILIPARHDKYNPQSDSWESEWIKTHTATRLTGSEAAEMRRKLPTFGTSGHLFLTGAPSKIAGVEVYADLPTLVEEFPDERENALGALADPGEVLGRVRFVSVRGNG